MVTTYYKYYTYYFIIESIHVSLLILFMIIDVILLYMARNVEFINNEYFLFHKKWGFFKKWGFLKFEIIKIFIAFSLIYELTHGTIQSGTILLLMLVYFIFVSKFLIDYISFKQKKIKSDKESLNENIT
jgi:hypothetical protein